MSYWQNGVIKMVVAERLSKINPMTNPHVDKWNTRKVPENKVIKMYLKVKHIFEAKGED